MDNEQNKQAIIVPMNTMPVAPEQEVNTLPSWIQSLEKTLGVDAIAVMTKQAESTNLVSEEEKADESIGLSKLADVSRGFYTENELIFMYVVGIKNLMNLTSELRQTKQMLQFFSGIATQMPDETQQDEPQQN